MARGAICTGSPWCVGMPPTAFRFCAVVTIVMPPHLWSNALYPPPPFWYKVAGGYEQVNWNLNEGASGPTEALPEPSGPELKITGGTPVPRSLPSHWK